MNNSTVRILATSLLAIASGCASVPSVNSNTNIKPYVPLLVAIDASPRATRAAVEKVLLQPGRTAQTDDGSQLEVLQYSATDERDRIAVQFLPANQIAVTFMTELQGSDGRWLSTKSVCATYAYAREREVADAVVASALGQQVSQR